MMEEKNNKIFNLIRNKFLSGANGVNKKLLISISVLLILGLVGGGCFLWFKYYKNPAPSAAEQAAAAIQKTAESVSKSAAGGVLPDISTAMVNPMEDVPDVNPYRNTNPFLNIKINPFK